MGPGEDATCIFCMHQMTVPAGTDRQTDIGSATSMDDQRSQYQPRARREGRGEINGLQIIGIILMIVGGLYAVTTKIVRDDEGMASKISGMICGSTVLIAGVVYFVGGCLIREVKKRR